MSEAGQSSSSTATAPSSLSLPFGASWRPPIPIKKNTRRFPTPSPNLTPQSTMCMCIAAVQRAADAAVAAVVVERKGSQPTTAARLARPAYDLLNACVSGAWGPCMCLGPSISFPSPHTLSRTTHNADFVLQLAQRANTRCIAQDKRKVTLSLVEAALTDLCPPPAPTTASKKRGRGAKGQAEEEGPKGGKRRRKEEQGKGGGNEEGEPAVTTSAAPAPKKGGAGQGKKQQRRKKVSAEEEAALVLEQEALFAAAAERHRQG